MKIFREQTVQQVKRDYPLLYSFTGRFPSCFMEDKAEVSVSYRVAKVAFQMLLAISSASFAVRACLMAPALFLPAFGGGLAFGMAGYLVQKAVRRKVEYRDSWAMLYINGSAILTKKWRWIEASIAGGAALAVYTFSSNLMQRAPTWACRQNGLGTGAWVGYQICDLLC